MDPPLVLRAECLGGLTRLTLLDADSEERLPGRDGASDVAMPEELTLMRDIVAKAPALIWRARADGQVVWANGPYLLMAAETLEPGQELTWPLPPVFDTARSGRPGQRKSLRQSVRRGDVVSWYEVETVAHGEDTLFYALPVDRLVQTEGQLARIHADADQDLCAVADRAGDL